MTVCYSQGIAAGRAGEPFTLNPYRVSNSLFALWLEGWTLGAALRARSQRRSAK
jgi:hypothetical protein